MSVLRRKRGQLCLLQAEDTLCFRLTGPAQRRRSAGSASFLNRTLQVVPNLRTQVRQHLRGPPALFSGEYFGETVNAQAIHDAVVQGRSAVRRAPLFSFPRHIGGAVVPLRVGRQSPKCEDVAPLPS